MKTGLWITISLTLTTGLAIAPCGGWESRYDKACKASHGATGAPNANIAKIMKVEMKELGGGPEHEWRRYQDGHHRGKRTMKPRLRVRMSTTSLPTCAR